MGKRKVNVRRYERKNGTPVRGYTKEVDNLRDYEPLSDKWFERMREKKRVLAEEKEELRELEGTFKELDTDGKFRERKLLKKINDDIDDPKEVLGKMSKKVDNLSVKKAGVGKELSTLKKEIKPLRSEIRAAKIAGVKAKAKTKRSKSPKSQEEEVYGRKARIQRGRAKRSKGRKG